MFMAEMADLELREGLLQPSRNTTIYRPSCSC